MTDLGWIPTTCLIRLEKPQRGGHGRSGLDSYHVSNNIRETSERRSWLLRNVGIYQESHTALKHRLPSYTGECMPHMQYTFLSDIHFNIIL
jgi:hypothetical protein